MKRLADVDEYWQAGHFGPALNLAEICGVDVAQFRKFFRCLTAVSPNLIDAFSQAVLFHNSHPSISCQLSFYTL